MRKITNLFISLFYSGYFKNYPGTFGTFISILILFPIKKYNILSFEIFIVFFILIFFLSLFFISKYSFYTKSHDSGIIVIDEFLGIYLIIIFYDFIIVYNDIITIILVFILFRFFDITKIFPANIIDKKINNAFGVLLDDLIAGVYTITTLYILNVYN
tara:strand:+ start:1899 stop:2372 length:474 start_codon:yes stop_codon:yes gene_type:complete